MHEQIRFKMRQQIRKKQINQIFQIKRIKHLESQNKILFKFLFDKIQQNIQQPTKMAILDELIELLTKYEGDENTYILINNYMIDHPKASQYLNPHLMSVGKEGRKTKNYQTVLILALSQLQSISEKVLDEFSFVVGILIEESSRIEEIKQPLKLISYLLELNFSEDEKTYYPRLAIEKFCEKIDHCLLTQLQFYTKQDIVKIVLKILQNFSQNEIGSTYMGFFIKIIRLVIDEFPNYRQRSLKEINSLFLQHPFSFEEELFSPQGIRLVSQINYVFQGTQKHKLSIITMYQSFIHQFSFQNFLTLLNNNFLGLLIHGLNSFDNDCIIYSLQTIKIVLDKVSENNDEHLLYQVLDALSLQNNLQSLGEKQLNKDIDNLIELIRYEYLSVDDY